MIHNCTCSYCHPTDPESFKCPRGGSIVLAPQGPEQPLVGESRSGPKPVAAEVFRESGGVGEIVGAAKLLRQIEEMKKEALMDHAAARKSKDTPEESFHRGYVHALLDIELHVVRLTEARSDLPNS